MNIGRIVVWGGVARRGGEGGGEAGAARRGGEEGWRGGEANRRGGAGRCGSCVAAWQKVEARRGGVARRCCETARRGGVSRRRWRRGGSAARGVGSIDMVYASEHAPQQIKH